MRLTMARMVVTPTTAAPMGLPAVGKGGASRWRRRRRGAQPARPLCPAWRGVARGGEHRCGGALGRGGASGASNVSLLVTGRARGGRARCATVRALAGQCVWCGDGGGGAAVGGELWWAWIFVVGFLGAAATGRLAVWTGSVVGVEDGEVDGSFLFSFIVEWRAVPGWVIPHDGAYADTHVFLLSFSWCRGRPPRTYATTVRLWGITNVIGGCAAVGDSACGLRWRDEQKRGENAAALRGESPLGRNAAAVSAAPSSSAPVEAAANGAEQGVAGGVVQAVADGTEQAVADSAEQAVADGTDQAAAALSAATAEAQAAAAQVVAAADSPAPSGSPTVDVAAGVPSIRPSADAFTDGATGPAPPGSASASPSTRPQAAGTPVRNPSPVADTASERSFEQEGADPWWCPQCATPDLPCPRVERGGKARCEGTFAVGGG